MYMPYTNNPNLPRVRMEAVKYVRAGHTTRETATHFGYSQSAIVKWVERGPADLRARIIPTRSSRPHSHPHELRPELVDMILAYRAKRNHCAYVVHHELIQAGYDVSLSSVKRTFRRNEVTRFSKWKKWHVYPARPMPERPGVLVEVDTVHDGAPENRLYLYTLLDVCSRWAYALPVLRINTHRSLRFVEKARTISPFPFTTLQSDHGSEFSKWFTKRIVERGMSHRHSRIRTPNDNAHLERFNRTIQEQCLSRVPRSIENWTREIPEFLRYYNTERPHMGLGMRTPAEVIKAIPSY